MFIFDECLVEKMRWLVDRCLDRVVNELLGTKQMAQRGSDREAWRARDSIPFSPLMSNELRPDEPPSPGMLLRLSKGAGTNIILKYSYTFCIC